MGYQVERGGAEFHQRFLKNPDYSGNWPVDSDWTTFQAAHVFENVNDAHKWVRDNKGEGIRELNSGAPQYNCRIKW